MVVRARLVLALLLLAATASAQQTPGPGTATHVICDSGCSGGSGGGGAATIADGADVTEGAKADAAVQGDTAGTISAKLRGLNKSIAAGLAVTGTFWQTTQPVSFTMPALVAGTAVIGHVIVDSAPSTAVTFTMPSLVAGTALIGKVGIDQTTDGTTNKVYIGNIPHVIVDTAPTTAVTGPLTDTQLRASAVPVSAATLPLPSNAAAETGGNLASIKTDVDKIPSQGQALAAASMPVVLPATQISTLTPPAAITGFALAATQTDRTQKAQVTDGTRDGTVKAGSTLPAASDTALVVTTRDTVTVSGTVTTTPPSNASTNVAQLAGTTTSTNSGTQDAGTLRVAVATDVGVNSATAALNGAGVTISLTIGTGNAGCGMELLAGTLAATITFQQSADNASWSNITTILAASLQEAAVFTFTNPNALSHFIIALSANAKYVRVNVTSYTSGTATAIMTCAPLISPFGLGLSLSIPGQAVPVVGTLVSGKDGGGLSRMLLTDTSGNLGTNVASINSVTPLMGNGTTGTGSQRVTIASDNTAFAVNANVAQVNGVTTLVGNGTTGTGSQRVTIASDNTAFSVNATPPTLTKATQGATGFSTQDLKDAGRSRVTFTADRVTPAASDTLVTFVKNVAGTATTAQTTYTVTTGKTLRVQGVYVGMANTSTVSANLRVALRENTGGTCTASSAAAAMVQIASSSIAANEGAYGEMSIPDGLEFPAADSLCISAVAAATTDTLTITVIGYEY